MNSEIRASLPGDEGELKALWSTVFGDEDDFIDSFFELLYSPGMARVCVADGKIVSSAYILKLGDLVRGSDVLPCSVIYAFGTLPEYRRRGLGRAVLDAAVSDAGLSGPVLTVPASSELFEYYEKSGFGTFFHSAELTDADTGENLDGTVTRATTRGYAALREELLRGIPHIDLSIPALTFQERLCEMYGGGLCYVVCDRVRYAAAVELHDGAAVIRELVGPGDHRREAAQLISRALGVERFTVRCPALPGERSAPFAMLRPAPASDTGLAWFGPAFD